MARDDRTIYDLSDEEYERYENNPEEFEDITDNTLEAIGKRFGGRSHATVKHSIQWVDDSMRESRVFYDRITHLRDTLTEE